MCDSLKYLAHAHSSAICAETKRPHKAQITQPAS
jgi:hypothetical protein